MADTKITALTALTAADPANDVIPIVDVSDTSMAASGTTKKISVNNILGASGTATLASATITGDLTVDTSTLKVDSANNRVGIGTASPAYLLDIADASFATRFVATNTNNSAYGAGIYLKTLNGASMVSNATLATSNDGTFNLITGTSTDSTKLSISTAGNVSVALGNVVMATSGKGIDFSATANSSGTMTSELLNDYEEGTFTPTLTFATPGTLAVTYNARSGTYTKIGNLVTVIFRVSCAAAGIIKGTASGGLSITGLPFTVGSTYSYSYADLGSAITDITTGSCALMIPITTSISFETLAIVGTRIERDSASLTAANFAASNGSFVTIAGTVTYTV